MSGIASMHMTLRKLSALLCIPAMLVWFGMSASSDAHDPVSGSTEASATPTDIRSRIEIGPIRELVPIFERERDDELSEFMHLVEDPNGVLSQTQASVLADDAQRLTVHGIPAMFVFRESSQDPDETVILASRLRTDKGLETAPGADDGMLFLITQTTGGSSRSMFLTISVGAHTLPKGGLNERTLQEVYEQSIRPRLRFGLVSDALKIGIRKIIYLETYYPDPIPPLTPSQAATRATVNVAAPIIAVALLISVVVSSRANRHGSPWGRRTVRRRYAIAIVLLGVGMLILAALAVSSRSEPGIIALSIGVLAIAAHVRLFVSGAHQPRRSLHRADVGPRSRLERRRGRLAGTRSVTRGAIAPEAPPQ